MAIMLPVGSAQAASIVVNSTGDAAADDGVCTLREALTAANDNAASGASGGECAAGEENTTAVDDITFTVSGTISPATSLPGVGDFSDPDEAAAVDASTAPGEVRIDGAGTIATCLDVNSDGSSVKGLTLTSCTTRGIDATFTDSVTIEDNLVGTDAADTAGLGHTHGIHLHAATGTVVKGNVIASNSQSGINIVDDAAADITITSNKIGTDSAGTSALPNATGIRMQTEPDDVTIGGLGGGQANLISGNTGTAIEINASLGAQRATGHEILGNRIGTTLDGESPLGNGTSLSYAVVLNGGVDGTVVRGNVISGNNGGAVRLTDASGQDTDEPGPTGNLIEGNKIGTDKDGEALLANGGGTAISVNTSHSDGNTNGGNVIGGADGLTVGGACTGDCNVIATDQSNAIAFTGSEIDGNSVLGNHIGLDAAGTTALDAGFNGVSVSGVANTTVGSPAAPNVVGAASNAIKVTGDGSGTVVQSNRVGVGPDGSDVAGFPPASIGVQVENTTSETLIGGTAAGDGNVVTGGSYGIRVDDDADMVAILGNTVRDTSAIAIELMPTGVTPNDVGVRDVDGGANGQQNFPELDAVVAGGSTHIVGSLDSSADTDFRLEFFSNAAGHSSGHGSAETFLGATMVTTDSAGLVDFVTTVPVDAGAGESVSATATELDGSGDPIRTSELAANETESAACGAPTTGDDVLCGSAAVDDLDGLDGDDLMFGLGDGDTLSGGPGDDILFGDGGADALDGGAGMDELHGGEDADVLTSDDDGGEVDSSFCGDGADTADADDVDVVDGDCETVNLTDTTPPETSIDSGPADGSTIATSQVTFGFSADDAGSTFTCSLTGRADEACDSGTKTYTNLTDGTYTFSVFATDPSSNVDPSPETRTFTVDLPDPPAPDTTPPTLSLSGKKKQKDKKKVVVKASCDEVCDLDATGTIKIKILKKNGKVKKTKKFDLKDKSKSDVAAGKKQKLKLKLTKKAKKKLKKVIKKKKSKAKIKVTATDAAGNATKKQKFKVNVKK